MPAGYGPLKLVRYHMPDEALRPPVVPRLTPVILGLVFSLIKGSEGHARELGLSVLTIISLPVTVI